MGAYKRVVLVCPDLRRVVRPRRRPAFEQVERTVAVVGGEAELLGGHGDERIPHLFCRTRCETAGGNRRYNT